MNKRIIEGLRAELHCDDCSLWDHAINRICDAMIARFATLTIDQMPFTTALRILGMVAYGCVDYANGYNPRAHEMLLIRMKGLLPVGETLPEFTIKPTYPDWCGDDVDAAVWAACVRLTGTPQREALAAAFPGVTIGNGFDGMTDAQLAS